MWRESRLEGKFAVITDGFDRGHFAFEGTVKAADRDAGTFRLVSRQVVAL